MFPNNPPPFGGPTAPPPYPDYANQSANPGLPPFSGMNPVSLPPMGPMGFSQPPMTHAYPTQAQPYPAYPNNNYSSGMSTVPGYPTPPTYTTVAPGGYPSQTYPQPPAYPGAISGPTNPAYPGMGTTPYGGANPSLSYPTAGVANPSPYPATTPAYPVNPNNPPSYPGAPAYPTQPGYGYR